MDREATSRRAPEEATVEVNIPVQGNGKRNIVDNMEEEKSYKFRAKPLVQKEALAIEANRQQRNKRNAQRQRENQRMEETKKELHESKEKLEKEQGMCKLEKEVQQE